MTPVRLLAVAAIVLSACGGAATPGTTAVSAPQTVAPTVAARVTAAPAASASTDTGYGGMDYDYSYGYGTSSAAPAVGAVTGEIKIADNAKLGKILTASNGFTIYTFKQDKPNTTTCTDQCAKDWPPFILASGEPIAPTGSKFTFGLLTRPDGAKQVTVNGLPLHFFAGDQKAGDINGDGFAGLWYAVKVQ